MKKKYVVSKNDIKDIILLRKSMKVSGLSRMYDLPAYFIYKILRGEYIGEDFIVENIISKSEA